MGNEIRPLMTPGQYVQEVLIKRDRPDIQNFKVVTVENLPDWAKASVMAQTSLPGLPVSTAAPRAARGIPCKAKNIHEDFYVLLVGVEMLESLY